MGGRAERVVPRRFSSRMPRHQSVRVDPRNPFLCICRFLCCLSDIEDIKSGIVPMRLNETTLHDNIHGDTLNACNVSFWQTSAQFEKVLCQLRSRTQSNLNLGMELLPRIVSRQMRGCNSRPEQCMRGTIYYLLHHLRSHSAAIKF